MTAACSTRLPSIHQLLGRTTKPGQLHRPVPLGDVWGIVTGGAQLLNQEAEVQKQEADGHEAEELWKLRRTPSHGLLFGVCVHHSVVIRRWRWLLKLLHVPFLSPYVFDTALPSSHRFFTLTKQDAYTTGTQQQAYLTSARVMGMASVVDVRR